MKIDRSFVSEMLNDAHTAAITEAIVRMAHVLDLQVIAEGVEQAGQIELLTRLGCDAIQGYYYSGAVTAERFAELLGGAPMAGPHHTRASP